LADSLSLLLHFLSILTVWFSIHHYYQGAPYTNMSDAVSVVVLDKLVAWFDQVDEGLRPTGYSQSKRPLSLGETSSFWGGGAVGISDRFVAGFTWLDKLGLAALRGWGSVFRQTFIGGVVPPFSLNYALVRQNLTPNPDFFNSVLFKRLVGAEVLTTKQVQSSSGGVDPLLRSYAFCTRPVPSDSLPAQYVVEGSVTIMWLSLHQDTSVTLQLEGGSGSGPRLEYTMSSASQTGNWQTDMASYVTRLNGVALELDPATGHLPRMPPRVVANGASSLTLAPLTYGFVVLPHAQAPACGFKKSSVDAGASAAPAAQAAAETAANKQTAHRRHRHARQADSEQQQPQHA
jgi:heparanase 1